MPSVSIVIATRDRAHWIAATIESVQRQTFTDWELVVVDDGSTDDTGGVVARFAGDGRIRWVPRPPEGRSAARNHGIGISSAPLVAFQDADDLWEPTKLARQVDALAADPAAGLCYTAARFIDATGTPLAMRKPPEPLAGNALPRLARGNVIILASVVVRRTCFDRVGTFEPTLHACEDWDLWLRIARHFPIAFVDEELTRYRIHPGNTARAAVLAGGLRVVDRLYADPEIPRLTGLSRADARARLYWYDAGTVAADDAATAWSLARQALRESPRTLASRPALGALAALALPAPALRAVRRLATSTS
jgi:glycosyltransferase involved in cell wall biosynthesis